MRYTFRQLEYFVAAGETESVKLAAARMNISQTSISSAIAHLELELGSELFTRDHRRGLVLTPFGRGLLAQAKRLLDEGERLHRLAAEAHARLGADEYDSRLQGRFAVACFVTLAPLVLPELTRGFCEIHPDLQLDILESQSKDPPLKFAISAVRQDVKGGLSLADALAKHPNCFSKLYVNMIRAAELGGILDSILDRLTKWRTGADGRAAGDAARMACGDG